MLIISIDMDIKKYYKEIKSVCGANIMIRFNNDYNMGAMKVVTEALLKSADMSFGGYGEDECCEKAKKIIRAEIGCQNADIHFLPGATQANYIVASAALNPVQSVIAADTGHICCHEAASVENSGHKILELPGTDGKINAEQIRKCAAAYYDNGQAEYLTEPRLVYISFPTEQGTLYSLEELTAISRVCREYGIYLFVDGARMAYGLSSSKNDVSLADFARLCDVFYLGGTKCGAYFGEALVITNDKLKPRFKAFMKQNGAVLAKGWLMGLQFSAMLESGEYFKASKRADEYAMIIKQAFVNKNIPLFTDSFTNQQFVILNDTQMKKLGENFIFEITGKTEKGTVARFCTSWATAKEQIEELTACIESL